MTQRQVGDVLGVDHRTVGRDAGANAPASRAAPASDAKSNEWWVGADAPASAEGRARATARDVTPRAFP
jgi:hypothetical protein